MYFGSVFSWRTTLTANLLNNSPRQSIYGLYADLAFTLLTYASALANLATSAVTSLGNYERERTITDAARKIKDEKLNFSVQLLLKASGVFAYVSEVVLPDVDKSIAEGRTAENTKTDYMIIPVDLSKEVSAALSK